MTATKVKPRAYRIKQAATILNLHPQTVRRLIQDGDLRAVKVGRSVLIPASAIDELLGEGGTDDVA